MLKSVRNELNSGGEVSFILEKMSELTEVGLAFMHINFAVRESIFFFGYDWFFMFS